MSVPQFQLSFQGYPAVLNTAELQGLIERDNAFRDMDWQRPARGWPGAATDLTFPLFTKDLPPIELNKLYYPESGIGRWGYVYLAFTGNQIESFKAHPTGTLLLETNNYLADNVTKAPGLSFANFTLVASVPLWEVGSNSSGRITGVADDTETLHLALLADERFWIANYAPAVDLEDVPATWESLINACATACSISFALPPTNISSDYGTPSRYSDWLESFQYNAAVMLDAALTNTGLILVRGINGSYTVQTNATANTIEAAEDHDDYFLRAGGDWSRNGNHTQYLGSLPASVDMFFPIWDENSPTASGMVFPPPGPQWLYQWDNDEGLFHLRSPLNTSYYYPVNVTATAAFSKLGILKPASAGTGRKIFRETAKACGDALTGTMPGDVGPSNLDLMTALALRVASDYYLSKYWGLYQETWNGLVPPSGSGWFTYIYYMGLDCWTKIRGQPANAEYEQLMHDLECESSSSGLSSSEGSSSEGSSSGCRNICVDWNGVHHGDLDPTGVYSPNAECTEWTKGDKYKLAKCKGTDCQKDEWDLTYEDTGDDFGWYRVGSETPPIGIYESYGGATAGTKLTVRFCDEPTSSEGSSSEGCRYLAYATCKDLVPAGRCWLGCDPTDCTIKHKTPDTTTAAFADCTKTHKSNAQCGIAVDDAGHIIGWWNYAGTWYSPWGIAEPAGGVP